MRDELTMANINLFAVLRNLEDLCELDQKMSSLIKSQDISMQFSVKGGPQAFLMIRDGKCKLKRGKKNCKIKLYFNSPAHLNQMFAGKKNPIPLKGLTKLGFLKNDFQALTDRLSYYLKPTEALLSDVSYFKINTILTAYTAFFALAEIGNTDRIGRINAKRIPDGIILVSVLNNGPAVYFTVKEGHLEAKKGKCNWPRAAMIFSNLEVVNALLNGKRDSYSCIANGDLMTRGYIPMLDNLNKLLVQLPAYLK